MGRLKKLNTFSVRQPFAVSNKKLELSGKKTLRYIKHDLSNLQDISTLKEHSGPLIRICLCFHHHHASCWLWPFSVTYLVEAVSKGHTFGVNSFSLSILMLLHVTGVCFKERFLSCRQAWRSYFLQCCLHCQCHFESPTKITMYMKLHWQEVIWKLWLNLGQWFIASGTWNEWLNE